MQLVKNVVPRANLLAANAAPFRTVPNAGNSWMLEAWKKNLNGRTLFSRFF